MRRVLLALVVLAIVAGAIFWFITAPKTVSASALGPHTADLDNGRTMFLAGGCASCHASPNQEDRTRLGGGMPLKTPFGTFIRPTSLPTRRMASALGARRTSLPRCGWAPRPTEAIITRCFP